VLFHHEKTDGSGYLYGKKGEEMGVLAQIVSIADVFDAITSKRSYKKNLPFWAALIHIQNEISKSFIPRLAQTFINNAHVFLSEQDIFPIGSIVTLNTGEIAEIAAQSQEQTLSPLIDIFLDSKQEPLRKPVRVDLALGDDRSIEKLIESPELITKLREIKKLHS
jgi:HD-GYP domain-containing protein (c-di-GMP phosphodiesterase class II)